MPWALTWVDAVCLSATPHNGYPESFSALLELLDNQRFARAIRPNRTQLEAVMVRRMKSELELRWDGTRRFAQRRVRHLEIPYTEAERQAHRSLRRYAELRSASGPTAGEQFATEFILKLLKKRLFSSPAAFAVTIEKHASSIASGKGGTNEKWLHDQLAAEGFAGQDRLLTIYGGMKLEDRERIKAAFQADPKVEAMREDLGKVGPVIAQQVGEAIRRGLIGYDVRSILRVAATCADLDLESLVAAINAVLKPGCVYTPNEAIVLAADYLGNKRMTDPFHERLESALLAASRRGLITRRGDEVRKVT